MQARTSSRIPLGIQDFTTIRRGNYAYVDKTGILQSLIEQGQYYFLARPRRFGKSLTVSTLEAMFKGEAELFKGLKAEQWVERQKKAPNAVIVLDMSLWDTTESVEDFSDWLNERMGKIAKSYSLSFSPHHNAPRSFLNLIEDLFSQVGHLAILIDEYDAPFINTFSNSKKAERLREKLREFYKILKGCSKFIRFAFLTGISKLTKASLFSALNNIHDISLSTDFSDITGYTEKELLSIFEGNIKKASHILTNSDTNDLLEKIRLYYDGYSFDGNTTVYNPFSILSFFSENTFGNYWYETGSTAFLETYIRQHSIEDPEQYRNSTIDITELSTQEIEQTKPESFFFQTGYLTIKNRSDTFLLLDYPNQEVLSAIAKIYLDKILPVPGYQGICTNLWSALKERDISELLRLYNQALANLPYQDFEKADESTYRALFLMLLRGAGIQAHGEVPTSRGRSDVLIESSKHVFCFEFKLAHSEKERRQKALAGERQIEQHGYGESYDEKHISLTKAVIVIDVQERKAYGYSQG